MTGPEFQRLLDFYLACVEAEDQRSLSIPLSSLHRSLVSPWDSNEPLFHPNSTEVYFNVTLTSDQKLLLGAGALAGGIERFIYGYPVFLDKDGYLLPLFITQVDIEHREGNNFTMRLTEANDIQLNHHIFRRQGVQQEELQSIQEELQSEYGAYTDRLRATFDALSIPVPSFPVDKLDSYPNDNSPRDRWVNRPVVFKSARNIYTNSLRRELAALVKYPSLYNRIDSTAAGYLAGLAAGVTRPGNTPHSEHTLLQVLPLNKGQEHAAHAALTMPLTVVTGPPGTGKSQVVVDLLASCAASGKPVLFASKNNKAVDVVRKRLREILGEERDWTLRLGSRNAMSELRKEMDERFAAIKPSMVPASPSAESLYELDEEIDAQRREIEKIEDIQRKYTSLQADRRVLEAFVDIDWVKACLDSNTVAPDKTRVERLKITTASLAGWRHIGIWLKLRSIFTPSYLRRRLERIFALLITNLPTAIQSELKHQASEPTDVPYESLAKASLKLGQLTNWRLAEDKCQHTLMALRAKEQVDNLANRLNTAQLHRAELTRNLFCAIWTSRILRTVQVIRHKLDDYFEISARLRKANGQQFLQVLGQLKHTIGSLGPDLPVWIVTNLSVRNALPLTPAIFDLVIIDEASQCDIPSALPLLFRARRALIIGDPHQLQHISTLSSVEEMRLASKFDITQLLTSWSYNQRSLYALAEGENIVRGINPIFLAEHYRSHPEIIEFSNHSFYEGNLIPRTAIAEIRKRIGTELLGLFWHNVIGVVPHTSRSAVNTAEVQAVVNILGKWASTGFLNRPNVTFGVVTPFRLQADRINAAIHEQAWWQSVKDRLIVGNAHQYQGDECDVMIFSPVVADAMLPRRVRWVADTHQLLLTYV
ncbi:MAG: DEAD/DEAH box helicase [Gammaproteobacteria bacterium]